MNMSTARRPAASLEADVVTPADFNNYGSDVFEFKSYECYNNNMYEQVNISAGINFTNAERRASIKWFKFTLNVAPRQAANVGHIAMQQPNRFPSRRTNTVFLRALLTNTGSLHDPSITKVVLRTRASTLATLYSNQGQPFEPAIKHSDCSLYADPAKFAKVTDKATQIWDSQQSLK
jgi:hypothetical protein